MGTYATNTSIAQILSQFAKDNSLTFDASGRAMVNKHITRAEGTVNGALARRYSLPFSSVPPEVTRITEDITCYYIIRATHWQSHGDTKNPYLEDFKTAFGDLKSIADGKSSLADTTGSLITTNVTGLYKSSTEDYTPIFDVDEPTAWAVSDAKITDMEDARE